jgi:hypothetical protein
MPRGYNRPLPFDHCNSFETKLFGWQPPLSAAQTAEIASVYHGFQSALAAGGAGRAQVSCIVLGRGEDNQKVRNWLGIAAQVPDFTGWQEG